MAAWSDELKQQAISMYQDAGPTPETSSEIIKSISEEMNQSPNGVRMILITAGVYVKKPEGSKSASKAKPEGDKVPRVSKNDQIDALRAMISERGAEVDESVLEKLTGKAAAYFLKVLSS